MSLISPQYPTTGSGAPHPSSKQLFPVQNKATTQKKSKSFLLRAASLQQKELHAAAAQQDGLKEFDYSGGYRKGTLVKREKGRKEKKEGQESS